MIYGYARVSTDGQSVDAQVCQLHEAGCAQVFREPATRVQTDREQFRTVVALLGADDVLMVTRLDRLARTTRHLLGILAVIAHRGAGFRSLGDSWADTTKAQNRLMLTVLEGLAEFDEELSRSRKGNGHVRKVVPGIKLGRKPKLTSRQAQEAITRRAGGEPMREIARIFSVHHSTISRLR